MLDAPFLAQEAHRIHEWFHTIFYLLVTTFVLLGVFLEYFRWPLGETPAFAVLAGRALVAAILLHTYPEVSNLLADISDGLSAKLGDLTQFRLALDKMGDKVEQLTWSWTSVRESIIVAISYLSFFLLYFSVHVAPSKITHKTIFISFSP